MAYGYGVILRLEGALWLTIIFKHLLTPQRAITIQFESYFWLFATEQVSMIWNVKRHVHTFGGRRRLQSLLEEGRASKRPS